MHILADGTEEVCPDADHEEQLEEAVGREDIHGEWKTQLHEEQDQRHHQEDQNQDLGAEGVQTEEKEEQNQERRQEEKGPVKDEAKEEQSGTQEENRC